MTELSQLDKKEKLDKVVRQIQELPTLPTMFAQINNLMMDPSTTAKEMGQLISSDPAITSKILRVVNSSFYGFPSRITTITHAIVILGFNTVKSIALSINFFAMDEKKDGDLFDVEKFWEHSISVGACTKAMAQHVGYSAVEELFIAGLLHDIGKLIFKKYFPSEFGQAIHLVKEQGIPLVQAEEQIFEVNHAELGAHLLENWKLSPLLVNCVHHHHSVDQAQDYVKEVSLVHLGNILAKSLCQGLGGDPYVPAICEKAWETLHLDDNNFASLLAQCWDETQKARIFVEIFD